ncbi:hypothetical protein LshimejAT787_1502160 [Lyophyllum shimeji]|uniref:Proliferating cell nuclear antigen PCNA N-terminal domain-containing protein n=1 Tax=Lyophyllum shimeji TaxID=47721 RepID=A0A9P3PW28_LYOSH|nr:hypothetical protein LshimejAT787_1502160 [Lyophyllum shimeji]
MPLGTNFTSLTKVLKCTTDDGECTTQAAGKAGILNLVYEAKTADHMGWTRGYIHPGNRRPSLLLHTEHTLAANAAWLIHRAAGAMATVKAFSTQSLELRTASAVFDALNGAKRTLTAVCGLTSALGQFTTLAMFVQGLG